MRSSKKVSGTTVKSRVLKLLEDGSILTATEAAHRTGSHWSTTSSLMYRLFRDRVLERIPNYGPLLGYGYFLSAQSRKVGQVGRVPRLKKKQEQKKSVPRSSNPYSEYTCETCGESRNGYENHHCPSVCPNTGGPHYWDTDCSYGPMFCKNCGRGR